MNTLEQAKAVRALLDKPEKWAKFTLARDRFGTEISPENGHAASWCMVGAIRSVTNDHDSSMAFFDALRQTRGDKETTQSWNDKPSTTYKEVIDVLDRTIARLEQESQG